MLAGVHVALHYLECSNRPERNEIPSSKKEVQLERQLHNSPKRGGSRYSARPRAAMEVEQDNRRSGGGGPDRAAQMQAQFEALVAQGAAAMAAEHGYIRSDPVTGVQLSPADEATLHRLLLERLYAKRLRDFDVADALRAQLRDAGVSVNDAESTYSIRPRTSGQPNHHGYTRVDDGSIVLSPADQATLDGMLLERLLAKRAREFAKADELRQKLRSVVLRRAANPRAPLPSTLWCRPVRRRA